MIKRILGDEELTESKETLTKNYSFEKWESFKWRESLEQRSKVTWTIPKEEKGTPRLRDEGTLRDVGTPRYEVTPRDEGTPREEGTTRDEGTSRDEGNPKS